MGHNTNQWSPFLNGGSFVSAESEALEQEESSFPPAVYEMDTPFRSEYRLENREGMGGMVDPEAEEFVSFLSELHDREFDETVFEMVNEAADLYANRFEGEFMGDTARRVEAERFLEDHFSPLVNEIESFLETAAEDIQHHELETMSEVEIDDFIEQYKTSHELSPAFENLWGWIKKKAKKAIKKGVQWAKKKAKGLAKKLLATALKKLKKFIIPWIKKIVGFAINKLPKQYRPLARKLAQRFGVAKEIEEGETVEQDEEMTGDVTQFQQEFDFFFANLLFTGDESQQERFLAEVRTEFESQPAGEDPLGRLDDAREQFVEGLGRLKEGEDAAPLVENFLPAVLPLVKLGLKFYGRPKLVNFLATYVAKLIRRFIGPKYTAPLSKAIVDAGLRLIHLEAAPEDETRAANEAVAAAVEETVRRVAALPEYVLDNSELLEGYVLEAFESAAAANLPAVLPETVYRDRPELRETTRLNGTWLWRPAGRKKHYKKFARMPEVEIDPHIAGEVKTWGGVPLSDFLRDRFRIPAGQAVRARVHLYEAIPGTWLSRIGKYEKTVGGLGTAAKAAWSQIHPLTPGAASLLVGEPRLGRDVSPKFLADPLNVQVGQRFYYLEIPGASVPAHAGPAAHRCCGTHLTMDFPRDQLRVHLFLGEADAQGIAVKLRRQLPLGTVISQLQASAETGLKSALTGGMYHQLNIVHSRAAFSHSPAEALKWIPPILTEQLTRRLVQWIRQGLFEYLKQDAQNFIAASQDPADGLTVALQFRNPPGLPLLRRFLAGEAVALPEIQFHDRAPETHIRVVPGYWYG